jgi:glycosyltransferase involved in cell wall biosynthesis
MLRILFQARQNIFKDRGGDTVQLEGTCKYLRKMGVIVDFDSSIDAYCSSYDIVHLFNITQPEETYLQLLNARNQGKPVCLSTIYWNMDKLDKENAKFINNKYSIRDQLKYFTKRCLGCLKSEYKADAIIFNLKRSESILSLQEKVLRNSEILLPNSNEELCQIIRDFPFTANARSRVIYNCIDPEIFLEGRANRNWGTAHGLDKYVLCVGRIEPRKNQLRLLNAMHKSEIPVVCVGRPMNDIYYSEVKRAKKASDILIEEINQKELKDIYASAYVHVLPSFYDTPGLVSLEAAAMGCNIVTSEIGCQREYFKEMVEYCDPNDERTILRAIEIALSKVWPNEILAKHVLSNYTWNVAAEQTLEVYKELK